MIHSENNIDACIHLAGDGPPSSALIDEFKRRYIMMPMAISASPQKSATAKPMLRRRRRKQEEESAERRSVDSLDCVDLRARLNIEGGSVWHVINRGQGPRQANAKEYVDRVAARHVSDAVVCRLILLGCNDAGKCICKLSKMQLKLDVVVLL